MKTKLLLVEDEDRLATVLKTFFEKEFEVTKLTDRMGMRLEGPNIENIIDTNIKSEGIIKGVIQVPADGNPIIMLSDHGTIGGYPKIGVVISSDYDKLVQLQPGSKIKFKDTGKNKADYDVDSDTINIKPTSRLKDFLVTVFHEIDHAKDAKKMGKKKYKQEYEKEMNIAVQKGKDAHDDNYFEKKAEKYGRKMASNFLKKN